MLIGLAHWYAHCQRVGGGLAGVVLLALSGCGLPSFSYLAPPNSGSVDPDPVLAEVTFDHNQDNDPLVFQGYQLYYKFYRQDSVESQFQTDEDAILEEPVTIGPSRLTNRGYHPVASSRTEQTQDRFEQPSQASPPTLNIDPDLYEREFEITLDFTMLAVRESAIAEWEVAQQNRARVGLFRNVRDSSENYKPFFPLNDQVYQIPTQDGIDGSIDSDLRSIQTSDQPLTEETITDNLAIGLFVLSYGQAEDDFSSVYSTPISLEYYNLR